MARQCLAGLRRRTCTWVLRPSMRAEHGGLEAERPAADHQGECRMRERQAEMAVGWSAVKPIQAKLTAVQER